MRKIILITMFLMIPFLAHAQCVGTIQGVEKGSMGQILVLAAFVVDGVPEPVIDKKTLFPEDLKGLTKAEMKDKITAYLDNRCNQIIQNKYKVSNGVDYTGERLSIASAPIFDFLKANEIELQTLSINIAESTVKIDSDGDKLYDQEWSIKTDGSKTVVSITPEPVNP